MVNNRVMRIGYWLKLASLEFSLSFMHLAPVAPFILPPGPLLLCSYLCALMEWHHAVRLNEFILLFLVLKCWASSPQFTLPGGNFIHSCLFVSVYASIGLVYNYAAFEFCISFNLNVSLSINQRLFYSVLIKLCLTHFLYFLFCSEYCDPNTAVTASLWNTLRNKTVTMYDYLMQSTDLLPSFPVPYWAIALSLRHTCHYTAGWPTRTVECVSPHIKSHTSGCVVTLCSLLAT